MDVQLKIFLVCIDQFLRLLMFVPFVSLYRGDLLSLYRNENRKIWWYGVLVILYSTFAFFSPDFYHSQEAFDKVLSTGDSLTFEPFYVWFITNITSNYFIWRFLIWGVAICLTFYMFKRLKINCPISVLIFALLYVNMFAAMRGSLGFALLFLGFINLYEKKLVIKILGFVIIVLSIFFHKSIGVGIALGLGAFFKLTKRRVILLLVCMPFLIGYITHFLDLAVLGTFDDFGDDMQIGSRLKTYSEGYGNSELNFFGYLYRFVQFVPIFFALVVVSKKVLFKNIVLPNSILFFYRFWFYSCYLGALFFFQESSFWISLRIILIGYMPMIFVLSYVFQTYKMNRGYRWILLLSFISAAYLMSYGIYEVSR